MYPTPKDPNPEPCLGEGPALRGPTVLGLALLWLVVVVVGGLDFPSAGPLSLSGPLRRTAQNFALFVSLGVFSLNFGGVFEGQNPSMCTFGAETGSSGIPPNTGLDASPTRQPTNPHWCKINLLTSRRRLVCPDKNACVWLVGQLRNQLENLQTREVPEDRVGWAASFRRPFGGFWCLSFCIGELRSQTNDLRLEVCLNIHWAY